MSHHRNIGVLAHYQEPTIRPSAHVPREAADELVRRLICERISSKLIRMLPPNSVYLKGRPNRPATFDLPEYPRPGAGEIPGVYFQPPKSAVKPTPTQMRAGWDWTSETDFLQVSARTSRNPSADVPPTTTQAVEIRAE